MDPWIAATALIYVVGCMGMHQHGEDVEWEDQYGVKHESPGLFGWIIVLTWPFLTLATAMIGTRG